MKDQNLPEVRFDDTLATPIYPRPLLKNAVLVPIPTTESGDEIPTFIKPNWGGIQVFYGSYYAIISDGKVNYGSARLQWEAMHTLIAPGYWVKTAVPTAYRAGERCRIITFIPSKDGGIRETSFTLDIGDFIVRQPGGEVQHIRAEKFDKIYFTEAEVRERELNQMTHVEFTTWVIAQAQELVPSL